MNNSNDFFQKFSLLKEAFEPNCKRADISPESAIFLIALHYGTDLSHFFKDEYKTELEKVGFITENNFEIKLTGKGSIFAKSLEPTLKKILSI